MRPKPSTIRDVLGKIQDEMNLQLTSSGAPEEIREFLSQEWTRLLASIYLAKGNQHGDWKAGWETVNALLWSLAPKHGREETGMLLRILPTLLGRLHEGCAALGFELAKRDALFERLAMLHAAIARDGLQYERVDDGPITHLREDESRPGMPGLNDLIAPNLPAMDHSVAVPTLKLGDQVMFKSEGGDRLLTLTWISPMGGMYMFANELGLEAITLTHSRLEARLRDHAAWLVKS